MKRIFILLFTLAFFCTIPFTSRAEEAYLHAEKKQAIDFGTVKQLYDRNRDQILAEQEAIAAGKDFPCVYIYTQEEQEILSREEYVPSVIDVFNCAKENTLSAAGGVRVRGNSTADQGAEKPYRIKFEKKQNMLGLHGGRKYKSWVLLRSYWHLATDYTAFNLAKTIVGGKYYSSDCAFVNLYINGEARGIYVLCEQNQANEGRVGVHEPGEGENGTDIGYLLEMDNYASYEKEHSYFTLHHDQIRFTDMRGMTRNFETKEYSVKSDINTLEQLQFIARYTDGVFTILYEGAEKGRAMRMDESGQVVPAEDLTPYEAVSTVIDLESLANMLILEELIHNYDVGAGSFYMAVDFSADSRYPRMTFLAPWDSSWAYEGSPSGWYYAGTFQVIQYGEDRSNPWYIVAMKADWFREIVRAKWAELSRSGALKETTARVLADCRALESDLGEDAGKIDKAVGIVDFVNARIDWLDEQWLEP